MDENQQTPCDVFSFYREQRQPTYQVHALTAAHSQVSSMPLRKGTCAVLAINF